MPASETDAGISLIHRPTTQSRNIETKYWKSTPSRLFTQAEFLDQRTITVQVLTFEVGQQALTTVNHHDQTATGVVILGVCLEVTIQVVDTCSQQSDLHFWRTSIVLSACIVCDNSGL